MKNILLTGVNGFLGSNFKSGFNGERVFGLDIRDADINCNIAEKVPQLNEAYDLVVHCAGKAHMIPKTDQEGKDFFKVNHQGTVNLCEGLISSGKLPKCFVLISTVSVYGKEYGTEITESTPLDGDTPYALSKIEAETFVSKWAIENKVNYLVLRLPLIVAENPPGNLGKMIAAIKKNRFLLIDKGQAKKSMVAAKDLPSLILRNMHKSGVFNLTDRVHPSFKEIEGIITLRTKSKNSIIIPLIVAKWLALIGDVFPFFPFNKLILQKMTMDLTFDDKKARNELDWNPTSVKKILSELKY